MSTSDVRRRLAPTDCTGASTVANNAKATEQAPIFVFVFAHPDDESMFFLPAIRALVAAEATVWFLCLTNGGYDGLGKVRETELEKAGKLIGASKVLIRSDDDNGDERAILDHPTKRYARETVANAIRDSLCASLEPSGSANRFVLVTFDELGVSGHVNHIDTYLGVCHLMDEQEERQREQRAQTTPKTSRQQSPQELFLLEAWHLESERNLFFKYLPLLSWMLLVLSLFTGTTFVPLSQTIRSDHINKNRNTSVRIFRMHEPLLNWRAMATHRSQFVWYRRLFVVFSSYTYRNKFLCKKVISSVDNID